MQLVQQPQLAGWTMFTLRYPSAAMQSICSQIVLAYSAGMGMNSAPGLQVSILEGKAYADLRSDATEAELESCVLLTNAQGKELLAPGRLAEQADSKKIILRLGEAGQVLLPKAL